MNYGSRPGWYSILDELHIFIWWQCHRCHKGQSLLSSMNPDTEEKLITIYIHDGDLCSVRVLCACVALLQSKCHKCVCVYTVCICERRWLHGNGRTEHLLNSGAGRLILHGLSKWEDRSHCSRYRMHPAVVPSAWIHMSGQTDLSPALSVLKKTKMLNTDMYSTFMRTWANSLSEGSVER